MAQDVIKTIEERQKRVAAEDLSIGDTVKVFFKIVEGKTERIQIYEGLVIAKKHGGTRETFTVRKNSYGVGVERVFPVHSPRITKVEVLRAGKVRRAKLYYLRDAVGKAGRVKQRVGARITQKINERNARVNAAAQAEEAAIKQKLAAEHAK